MRHPLFLGGGGGGSKSYQIAQNERPKHARAEIQKVIFGTRIVN